MVLSDTDNQYNTVLHRNWFQENMYQEEIVSTVLYGSYTIQYFVSVFLSNYNSWEYTEEIILN